MMKKLFITIVLTFFIFTLPSYPCGRWRPWWSGMPYGTSGAPPGPTAPPTPPPNPPPPNPPPPSGGEPVDLFNGAIIYLYQDLVIPSKGINIDIRHIYNNQSRFNGRFGLGWELNYNKRVVPLSNGDAAYLDGQGGRTNFSYINGTNYLSPQGVFDSLVQNPDGTYTLSDTHGTKYNFAANGTLSTIVDRNNNTVTFTYNSSGLLPITGVPVYTNDPVTTRIIAYQYMLTKITTATGKEITFTYDVNGRLSKITDFIGREIRYSYDNMGHLTSITDPLGKITAYTYDSDRNLYTVIDRRNNLILTHNYNQADKVISQVYGSESFYFNYDSQGPNSRVTEYTDEEGGIWKYYFSETGRPIQQIDSNGNITAKTYYENMCLSSIIYPDQRTINYEYDVNGNITKITQSSLITTFTYNLPYNLITSITYPDETVHTFEYDANGNLLKTIDRNGGTTIYTYNSLNFSITNPLGQVTTFVFDNNGYITAKTTPDGKTITYAYDPVGNCIRVTDSNNLAANYEYDACNQLKKMTDPDNNVTAYSYDGNGNLIEIVYPDMSLVSFTYDQMGRLIDPEQAGDLPPATYNPTTAVVQEFIAAAFRPLPYRYLHSIRPQFGHCFSLAE